MKSQRFHTSLRSNQQMDPGDSAPSGTVIELGTFCGGEIEPGTFHGTGRDAWVDDRPDVNEPLVMSEADDLRP